MLIVEEQLHTDKMQKQPKPSIMNSESDCILLRISETGKKKKKETKNLTDTFLY